MLAEPSNPDLQTDATASESSKGDALERRCFLWVRLLRCVAGGETETVDADVFQHFANAPGPEPFSFHPAERKSPNTWGWNSGASARLAKLLRDIRAETPPVSSRSVHEVQGGFEAGPGPGGPGLVPALPIAKAAEPLELGETASSFPTGLVSTSDSLTLSASPAGVAEERTRPACGYAACDMGVVRPMRKQMIRASQLQAIWVLSRWPKRAILKETPMEADPEVGCREEAAVTLPEGDAGASLAEVAPRAPSEVDSEPSSIDRLGDKEKQALAAAHQTLTEMAKLLLEAAVESPAASPRPEATDD
eukprot:s632_g29.t2